MKTGMTEVTLLASIVGVLDVAQHTLATNPIIPEPWGVIVLTGVTLFGLIFRQIAKAKGVPVEENKP